MKEYNFIKADLQHSDDYLQDLIGACIIVYSKVVAAGLTRKLHRKIIKITMPTGPNFIHHCYIEIARLLYSKAKLFFSVSSHHGHSDTKTPLDKQHDVDEIMDVIRTGIITTIRTEVPIKQVLDQYLGRSAVDDTAPYDLNAPVIPDDPNRPPIAGKGLAAGADAHASAGASLGPFKDVIEDDDDDDDDDKINEEDDTDDDDTDDDDDDDDDDSSNAAMRTMLRSLMAASKSKSTKKSKKAKLIQLLTSVLDKKSKSSATSATSSASMIPPMMQMPMQVPMYIASPSPPSQQQQQPPANPLDPAFVHAVAAEIAASSAKKAAAPSSSSNAVAAVEKRSAADALDEPPGKKMPKLAPSVSATSSLDESDTIDESIRTMIEPKSGLTPEQRTSMNQRIVEQQSKKGHGRYDPYMSALDTGNDDDDDDNADDDDAYDMGDDDDN
jgi:hypothetical protein